MSLLGGIASHGHPLNLLKAELVGTGGAGGGAQQSRGPAVRRASARRCPLGGAAPSKVGRKLAEARKKADPARPQPGKSPLLGSQAPSRSALPCPSPMAHVLITNSHLPPPTHAPVLTLSLLPRSQQQEGRTKTGKRMQKSPPF